MPQSDSTKRAPSSVADEITERKQAERAAAATLELLSQQNDVLARVVRGTPLSETLDHLLRAIESHAEGMLCSILLLDEDGVHLRHGAAPSLPDAYVRAIDGEAIGPVAGSCGTAAHRREPVVVEDIAADPLWAPYRDVALSHGLRACWSTPILDGRERVLGTFASYFRTPALPTPWHRRLIEVTTYTAALAIVHDREQRAAQRREAQFAEAQRIAQLGSYEWDAGTNEARRSEELCRIFGLERATFPPTFEAYLDRVYPADRSTTRATIEESARTGRPFDFEERIVRPDGAVRWLRSQGRWIGDATGSPAKLVGICQDITDRKHVEEQIRRSDALRVRNEELQAFAYMVSHDLKAPLRSIAGYARELDRQHRSGLSPRSERCVKEILAAIANLEDLIEDLLRYCRLDREMPSRTDVDLAETVGTIVHERVASLPPGRVEVSTDLAVTHVSTWQRGLAQILANLVDNAVKFSADARPARVRIRSQDAGDVVRITVADNGVGFDMKHHDRIFGLFNRLDPHGRFEGTGAGLAIVKRIADRIGASVRAESAPDAGATFFVDVPRSVSQGMM
jgi:PAS domain S-box-containing protein